MARPVRFNIHPKQTNIHDNIALADMPEGARAKVILQRVLKR
jgi:NADH-quinone oxidoreductase subunit B